MDYCTQCGEDCEEFVEGYCAECAEQNQRELDEHITNYDRWQSLSDAERDNEIKNATR